MSRTPKADRPLSAILDEMARRAASKAPRAENQAAPAQMEFAFPKVAAAMRAAPNAFVRSALFPAIQGGARRFVKGLEIASQGGIAVRFTGERLNQEDFTLWQAVVHTARDKIGEPVEFSAYSILRTMELHTGGAQHRALHDGLVRLTACAVEVQQEKAAFFGPLLNGGSVLEYGEPEAQYVIRVNPDMVALFGHHDWTGIDWDQRRQLRRKPLAQLLHCYYSSHRKPHPVKVATLHALAGSESANLRSFKQQLGEALDALAGVFFLASWAIDGDLVTVARAQRQTVAGGGCA